MQGALVARALTLGAALSVQRLIVMATDDSNWFQLRDLEIENVMQALRNIGRDRFPHVLAWEVSMFPVELQYYILRGVARTAPHKILHKIRNRTERLRSSADAASLFGGPESDEEAATDHSSDFYDADDDREVRSILEDMVSSDSDGNDRFSDRDSLDEIDDEVVRRHE